MIRFLYNLAFPFALLVFLPRYLLKMRRRGQGREKFGQRLGWYSADVRARLAARRSVWMHAVSVGEAMIALKLAAQMKAREPSLHIALTTTTTTGFALLRAQAPTWIEPLYTPLDFWPVMRRAFLVIRPERIVLVEAEVWPNLAARAHAERIPLALVNARLSPRSERRFRQFRFALAPVFARLDLVCVQEPEDIARWEALGVARERIELTGSIKFDSAEPEPPSSLPGEVLAGFGIAPSRPILLGGSTHEGEELILANILQRLRPEFPELFLIIAPRHVERTAGIARQLAALGWRVALRSVATAGANGETPDILLLDTTGELRAWYPAATVVFIGKSLSAHGGQNPVEPILARRPVVFGPHMENFDALARTLLAREAALQVSDTAALESATARLLRDPALREQLVGRAHAALRGHRGATARTADLLCLLAARGDSSGRD